MANGNGGTLPELLKYLVGDVPAQWIRLMLFGALCAAAFFTFKDFKRELRTYVQANQVWQEASKEERTRFLRKANIRLKRLYTQNGWEYEEIEP